MKVLLLLLVLFTIGCGKHEDDTPDHVQIDAKPEKVMVIKDYHQNKASQTVMMTINFDGHKWIIIRGEYGEDFAEGIHHPDCRCKR